MSNEIKECKDKIDKLELSQSDIKVSNIIKRELINYAEETINGIACNKHKWACKRFLDDLKDKNLFFDEEEVRRVYEWATHLHHIVGPLAGENIELNDISKFVIGNIYGLKYVSTGQRKYNKVYYSTARNNNKTTLSEIIATYEAQKNNLVCIKGIELYSIIAEELSKYFGNDFFISKRKKNILNKNREEIITAKLNDEQLYECICIDELYDISEEQLEYYYKISNGILFITTTISNMKEYKKVTDICTGLKRDDRYFILVCEADEEDLMDIKESIIKANPIYKKSSKYFNEQYEWFKKRNDLKAYNKQVLNRMKQEIQ